VSSGEEIHDDDAVNLSHVGDAVHRTLGQHHNRHHLRQWNVTSGKIVGSVQDTPRGVVDRAEDPATANDDWFPEKLAEIISRTESWCDIMSLGPPDGKFLTAFQTALATLSERSKTSEKPIVVRMLFGNIAGMPVNCDGVIKALTSNLPQNDSTIKLHLWVGAWRKGLSWNHAKLIAVDGTYLHTGGHNLWDAHYLSNNPVHDLSFELEGKVARDGHRFANQQWAFVESKQSTCMGCVVDSMPDYLPLVLRTRVTVSEWPKDKVPVFPPQFTKRRVLKTERLSTVVADPEDVPLISIGRLGTMVYRSRPSDDAILAMINSSKTIIRLVLQDLGPVCVPGTKKALPGLVWPKEYLGAIGNAIYERGVDVEMILSNPNSIPGGLKGTEANYGNGWDCVDVAAEIIKSIQKQHSNVDDAKLRAMISDNLRICFVRHAKSSSYEDGKTIGLHSKHFIVDDKACYIGSQNLYMCDLAEWGIVIDHEGQVKKIMNDYFSPMWENSYTGEDVDVEYVMDGLDVDRDGEKQSATMFGGKGGGEDAQPMLMPHGTNAEYYNIEKDDGSEGTDEGTDEPASPVRMKSRGIGLDPADDTEREESAPAVHVVEEDSPTSAVRDDVQTLDADGESDVTAATPTARDAATSDDEETEVPGPPLLEIAQSFGAGLESFGGSIAAGLGAGLESLGLMPVALTADQSVVHATTDESVLDATTEESVQKAAPGEAPSSEENTTHASSAKQIDPDVSSTSSKDVAAPDILEKDTVASAPSDEEKASPATPPATIDEKIASDGATARGEEDPIDLEKQESSIAIYEPPAKVVVEVEEEVTPRKESMALDCCGITDCLT